MHFPHTPIRALVVVAIAALGLASAVFAFVGPRPADPPLSIRTTSARGRAPAASPAPHADAAGSGSTLAVTTPSTATIGTAVTVTVTAKTSAGATATDFTDTIHFTSTDATALLPPDSTLVSGTKDFNVTFGTAGTQRITATDTSSSSIKGTSGDVAVTPPPPGPATQLSVDIPQGFADAGSPVQVTVTALDENFQKATSYRGTIHFTSSDSGATTPTDYTFVAADNGAHQFTVTFANSGDQTLTATDKATASINGVSGPVTVSATSSPSPSPTATTSPSPSPTATASPSPSATTTPRPTATPVPSASPRHASVTVSPSALTPGQRVVVSGSGFDANKSLNVYFHSTPVLLGAVRTNSAGAFTLSATVPSSLAAGAHTVTVNATSGGAQLASDPVTVQSAGASSGSSGSSVASPSNGVITLPRTGAEIARFVAIALFIGGLGLILVGLSRFVLERR